MTLYFSIINNSEDTVIAYGFKGGIQIPPGETHKFEAGSGYNVVVKGQVLFDVMAEIDGPVEVKPRDNVSGYEDKVAVAVYTKAD
ncbi:hypothetical protein PT974_10184 [Cladobotryum mycophilum]|uniref:Uncharacterized protein n=1 Tax=Cladobotryum mycophilum TaxID=491253 RepID=A0ABR0SA30_9HYPO